MDANEIFFRAMGMEIACWIIFGITLLALLRGKGLPIEIKFWVAMFCIGSLMLALIGEVIQMYPEKFVTPAHSSRRSNL